MYTIKEIYFTKQGEGFHTGRNAIFLRFTGCNLWTGLEQDRTDAVCNWCDTDFVGTNGIYGGKYSAVSLAKLVKSLWPDNLMNPFLVCTGGEPLLQMDDEFIQAIHKIGFEIAIETNGTIVPPKDIDWICVSPKANADFIYKQGNELKIVYPQVGMDPKQHESLSFDYFFIQPMDGGEQDQNIEMAKAFITKNPKWELSLQMHKIWNIP